MNLILDIETVPGQHPQARADARAGIKPPGTLKRPESIAAWWENEADAAAEEAWRRQSLDGGTAGEIISIAVVADDDRQWVRCRQPGDGEAELLRQFFATVEAWTAADAAALLPGRADLFPLDDHRVVAHNASFDVGFLWRRSRVHGVPVPRWLPGPMARAGRDYDCTMQMWSGYAGRISLDALCRALGVTSPKAGGFDGSQVLDSWLAVEYGRIAEYNLRDALAVREVWHRLMGHPGDAA